MPAKTYLSRNHDILLQCDMLVAALKTREEEERSGTWATVRYAKIRNVTVVVLEP
jgi:hypothetical protein